MKSNSNKKFQVSESAKTFVVQPTTLSSSAALAESGAEKFIFPLAIQFLTVMLALRFPEELLSFFHQVIQMFHSEVAPTALSSAQAIMSALANVQ